VVPFVRIVFDQELALILITCYDFGLASK